MSRHLSKSAFSQAKICRWRPTSALHQALEFRYRPAFIATTDSRCGVCRQTPGTIRTYTGGAPQQSHYQVLGIRSTASFEEVKKVYYALAKELHADLTKGDTEAVKKAKAKRWQMVSNAYEIVGNPIKRQAYHKGNNWPYKPHDSIKHTEKLRDAEEVHRAEKAQKDIEQRWENFMANKKRKAEELDRRLKEEADRLNRAEEEKKGKEAEDLRRAQDPEADRLRRKEIDRKFAAAIRDFEPKVRVEPTKREPPPVKRSLTTGERLAAKRERTRKNINRARELKKDSNVKDKEDVKVSPLKRIGISVLGAFAVGTPWLISNFEKVEEYLY